MIKYLLSIVLTISMISPVIHGQGCEITAVNATVLPCNGYTFSVSVDLEVVNPESPGFTLAGNGVIYGTFLYDDLPVTVGPLLGDDESTYEFIAWDVENASCQQYTTLPAANCGPICSISNFNLDFITCVSNQSALVEFNFTVVNPMSSTFDLYNEQGTHLGQWLYSSLPVTLPAFQVNGAAPIVLTVCDHNNAECCETFVLDAIDCNPNNCEIFSVIADPQCTGNNFVVHLNFGYDNPASDTFKVMGNNINYGKFAYSDLPITLGPLNGNSNIMWEFIITDNILSSCTATKVLGIYNCPPPCDVLGLEALALECNGNEAYALSIGLDIEGEGDTGFAVFSETYYYGSYSYNSLPLIIPAFMGSGESVDIVSVCDNQNLGCCATTPFEALLCAGCLIYNISAIPQPCNAEEEFFVSIDFSTQNVSLEGFEITGNGSNYGQFSYSDLPVLVGPFIGDGSQYLEFVITDLIDPLCFGAIEIGFVDCDDICQLSNAVVETGVCTGPGTYTLHLDFDYQGVSGVGFDLFLNGVLYDSYMYEQLPLTIADFPSSGAGPDTITVCENDNEQCCTSVIFEAPECPCFIGELSAEFLECVTDSTFSISVEFYSENLPSNFADVFLDGVFIGLYNIEVLPFTVVLPEGDGSAILTVCASDLGDCCADVLIELVTCEPPACDILDLLAETGDCNSDSTYVLDVLFDWQNLPGDSVIITANNQFIGQFQVNPEFIRIEQFPVFGEDTTTITVCAVGAPDCCASYSYVTPDCSTFGQCNIAELVAEAADCTSDSTYTLNLSFSHQNLPTDSVVVASNGVQIGQFQINGNNLVIEHFPVSDSSLTTITVCAVGAPDCCDEFTYETPDCSTFGQCILWDLATDSGECNSDTTFTLHLFFNSQYLPNDSVIITANGDTLGIYPVTGENIIIENVPTDSALILLIVCAMGNPECCDTTEVETPDCSGFFDCSINELQAEAGPCTSDTSYVLDIVFTSNNFPNDSVLIYVNDELLGQYFNHPDFIRIEDFPKLETEETTITVCASGAPDCCASYTFDTPFCTNECIVYNVSVEVFDCNSDTSFAIVVDFDYQNIEAGGFDIYSGDQYLGFYTFEQVPAEVNFPTNSSGQYVVTICESDSTVCCTNFEFEGPVCGSGNCEIFNVEYALTECDSAGNFYFILNFDFLNTGSEGFTVEGNGNQYGTFSYDSLPIQIGPFETSDVVFEFLFADGQFGDCTASIEPGMVECLDVSTTPVSFDPYFMIFNNGTIPGIYARQDLILSLYNMNGKSLVQQLLLPAEAVLELNQQPAGLYFATIMHGEHIWPVKLVKTGH